ncbi:nickel transporter permease NikC [Citrobacter amalonaticus]|nr:nickel transporter permease NikC [Citrobacter amalonaticus]
MNFFLSSRWSVRLAMIVIALLAVIALTSQWWLPYDPQAIDLPSRLLAPTASTGWVRTIWDATFSLACWRRPACRWVR